MSCGLILLLTWMWRYAAKFSISDNFVSIATALISADASVRFATRVRISVYKSPSFIKTTYIRIHTASFNPGVYLTLLYVGLNILVWKCINEIICQNISFGFNLLCDTISGFCEIVSLIMHIYIYIYRQSDIRLYNKILNFL